ncbi:hypothetical protein F5Y06DRAFT_298977 [Hypoxylon sp. FL0890]|nr:hypothetical protein F5Y06DRAFT_298977 [Hypoxylon sp. FL0890]
MPRPVETLDIALPAGHPLKRPVSNRNKQAAQRIYQLWNIWPWQLFPADSPHIPTVWTDNILDKLKTIALCTTLSHARRLLEANIHDGQPLSLAVLNAVIDECKEESDTPRNPAVKHSKRKQSCIVVGDQDRHGDERGDTASSQGGLDRNDEEYRASSLEHESSQQDIHRGARHHPLRSSTRRLRGRSLTSRYSMSSEPVLSQASKRRKRRHHSTSTPVSYTYITPPESMPTSASATHGRSSQSNTLLHCHLEDTRPTLSSDGIAAYFDSVVVQLSGFFQEQCLNYEQAVEGARLQLRTAESRLVSLKDELDAVKKEIDELEQQKSDMERTLMDLVSIEKEEEQLAARRRELMMRRISASWRPSPSLSSPAPDSQYQPQLPLSQTRASDELQAEINALVADRLAPNKKREADLKIDIANTKSDIEAARAQVDASAADLNAKSDELIRWRGFSNDVQDALIRRGFAEPAFMWEFSQKDTDRRDHRARFTPVLPVSRPATATGKFDSPLDSNNDSGVRAGSPNLGITPIQSSPSHFEGDRRNESF